jgi:hypothetical protein
MRAMPTFHARIPRMTPEMQRALAVVSVERVDDPSAAAGLFRRKFGDPLPDFPAHYLATLRDTGVPEIVGYVHMTRHDEVRLCGGLCVDHAVYRRMGPAAIASHNSSPRTWATSASWRRTSMPSGMPSRCPPARARRSSRR